MTIEREVARVKKNPKCSRYDLRALEQWLVELAADGFELSGEWAEFDEGEKQEKRFYIEPAQEKGGVPKALLDSRAMMGWEYVCNIDKGAFYVWRSVGRSANPPRPREMAGSWCDKRLTRRLRNWWLGVLAIFVMYAGYGVYAVLNAEMPLLWSLLTNRNGQWAVLSLLLTVFCGVWAMRREHRDLRRLRKAVRSGEYLEPVAQHTVWYEIMNALPVVVSVALLLTTCAASGGDNESRAAQGELASYPMLRAEALGGAGENRWDSRYGYALCDTVVVREGDWIHTIDKWRWPVNATQLEAYRPRVAALAKPLAAELRDYYGMERAETPDGADEAWYCPNCADAQYFLLRGDGLVLLYRTDAPDDLRRHADEFAELLAQYRETVLTR